MGKRHAAIQNTCVIYSHRLVCQPVPKTMATAIATRSRLGASDADPNTTCKSTSLMQRSLLRTVARTKSPAQTVHGEKVHFSSCDCDATPSQP